MQELTGAISVLTADVQHTKDLKHKVEQTVQDTIVATRIVEGFRNPQQNGQYLKTYANFPLECVCLGYVGVDVGLLIASLALTDFSTG